MNPKPTVNLNEPNHMKLKNDYWKLAWWGIRERLLTKEEADTIARVGHRKEIFWGRHLRDLVEILEDREMKRENQVRV